MALPSGLPDDTKLYIRPILAPARDFGPGRRLLAGGPLAFDRVQVRSRPGDVDTLVAVEQLLDWAAAEGRGFDAAVALQLERLTAPRSDIAGLSLDWPRLMGVLNVTPDSFSDGGSFVDAEAAVDHAWEMIQAGVDLIDVGGESTRPGAAATPAAVEAERVLPVLAGLGNAPVPLSIDSRHAAVMRAAADAGVAIINDVSALRHDPDSLAVAAACGLPVVLMHARGDPATMQDDPVYDDVLLDIYDFFDSRIAACEAAGVPRDRLILDPGIGFGKTLSHNLRLLRGLSLFHGLGCPLLLGVSRKGFIGRLSGEADPAARLSGSLAAMLQGLGQGVQMVRVHDVGESRQAVTIWHATITERAC